MIIKDILDETITDYNKTSMLIVVPKCTTKCWEKLRLSPTICQNHHLYTEPNINVDNINIIKRYMNNPLTNAVIFGGLDAWDSIDEILEFIRTFRDYSLDDVVLYTGRGWEQLEVEYLDKLKAYRDIYIKYGNYNPNLPSVIDELTKVSLISNNQKFIKIS